MFMVRKWVPVVVRIVMFCTASMLFQFKSLMIRPHAVAAYRRMDLNNGLIYILKMQSLVVIEMGYLLFRIGV